MENLQGAVPGGKQLFSDVMLRVRMGRHRKPVHSLGTHRLAVRRQPWATPTTTSREPTTRSSAGFRQTSLGNTDLKWEENRSTNVGADIALFDGKINVVVDVYQRSTNNLLFDPAIPGNGRRRRRADRQCRQDEEPRL